MDFSKFDAIYKFTNPKDLLGAVNTTNSQTNRTSLLDTLLKLLINPNGQFTDFAEIKTSIESRFTGDNGAAEKKMAKGMLHAINSATTNITKIDFDDADYWEYTAPDGKKASVANLLQLAPNIGVTADAPLVTVFLSKSPYLTPAKRGTDAVEMFLNYMPSIFASRMMPYLEVEFQLASPPIGSVGPEGGERQSAFGTNTPSMLRFLLGSGGQNLGLPLTDGDLALRQVRSPSANAKNEQNLGQIAYSGMEMFLMPQTLSPMDRLAASDSRLVPVKPFVPFASVEDMSIQIMNAGAGAMAHKKGSLKLKIHDKARLAEISEFIRGPSGYKDAVIWTTYGWLAPRTNDDLDAYAKFINENMIVTDCWQVANTQFSFDAVGQVSLSLEMVSKGITSLQKTSIAAGTAVGQQQQRLKQAMETIAALKQKVSSGASESLGVEVRAEQILNAASRGTFPELKEGENVNTLLESFKTSGRLTSDELTSLKANVALVQGHANKIATVAGTSVVENLKKACEGPDPFLADPARLMSEDQDKGYFSPDLHAAIKQFNERPALIAAENAKKKQEDEKEKKADKKAEPLIALDGVVPVVSFGKLFTSLVVPAILSQRTCSELQIIFYGLNDQCGPVSGHSIAEFPIDTKMLAYAYRDLIKTGTAEGNITIEEFLRLIVNSQFADNRAIGYGMASAFEPFNPSDRAAKNIEEKEYESRMTDWLSKYGTLQRPIIEMVVESGPAAGANALGKHDVFDRLQKSQLFQFLEANPGDAPQVANKSKVIKRIHIYDKQNNPHKLISQVLSTGPGEWSIGKIDVAKVKAAIKKLKAENANITDTEVLQQLQAQEVNFIERPAGQTVSIGGGENQKSVREVVKHMAPNIIIGTNGTLIKTANLASKTDGLMGAINIINANKNAGQNGPGKATLGLESPNGLPLRVVPAQLTMTSMGCPIAQLYQQYFIDFGTGTTIDNLYNCTQIQHSIGAGKFDTSWTFAYTDGYGKFGGAGTLSSVVTGEFARLTKEAAEKEAADKKATAAKKGGGKAASKPKE